MFDYLGVIKVVAVRWYLLWLNHLSLFSIYYITYRGGLYFYLYFLFRING